MAYRRIALALSLSAIAGLALVPAWAASSSDARAKKPRLSFNAGSGLGSFTPAASDPRLAALLARSGMSSGSFRFTPASASVRLNRSVTVAVRARRSGASLGGNRVSLASTQSSSIAPIAYNLGVAVGWKRFALSSNVEKVDFGSLGGREAVDLGVSYSDKKWSTRVAVGGDRPTSGATRSLTSDTGYSLDVGGSYSLSRNLDVTAGVRYRAAERDRLQPLADTRRDSQAVYVGTAFKF